MNRLTARNKDSVAYYVDCFADDAPCGGGAPGDECLNCSAQSKQCEALARFEDLADIKRIYDDATGPKLARLRELAIADAEGRAVMFPCRVGDKVYMVNHHGFVKCGEVEIIHINNIGAKPWVFTIYFDDFNGPPDVMGEFAASRICLHINDFGKTAFLSPEAAEAAQRGKQSPATTDGEGGGDG